MEHNENRIQTRNAHNNLHLAGVRSINKFAFLYDSLRAKCYEILTEIFTFNQQPNDKFSFARNYF